MTLINHLRKLAAKLRFEEGDRVMLDPEALPMNQWTAYGFGMWFKDLAGKDATYKGTLDGFHALIEFDEPVTIGMGNVAYELEVPFNTLVKPTRTNIDYE